MENENTFPYEFKDLKKEELDEIEKYFTGIFHEFIRVGPKGYLLPKEFKNQANTFYNMPIRPSDHFVVTYQRSGTTMTQELVWLLVKDFDYETAKSTQLSVRFPFLEVSTFLSKEGKEMFLKAIGDPELAKDLIIDFERTPVEILAETADPRFIKSHLPLSLLSPKLLDTSKVIYVARDPRDVAVSSYHHAKLFAPIGLQATFKDFWNLFRNNLFTITPYFEHIKEAWAQRNNPNMLFLFYEDIRQDLPGSIRRIAKFLGKEPTEEQISGLSDHLSFDNFKNNKAVNYEGMRPAGVLDENEQFIRKGKSGGWREYFDEEMTKQAETWIIENLRGTDLRYPSMQDIQI